MWFQDRLRATLWQCRLIVRAASWLVPPAKRSPWRSERNRKFFHWCHFLAESGQLTPQKRLTIARACWAVFPEALWLRVDRQQFHARSRRFWGSPVTFLAALALIAVVLVLSSGIIKAARAAFAAPVPHATRTVLIYLDGKGINGKFSRTRSDTLLDLTSIWSKSKLAQGLTAFSWGPGNLLLQNRDLAVATARVGPEFFTTLDVKPALGRAFTASDMQNCRDCVVLSYPVWQHEFHSDPKLVGKSIELNGISRTVIGILPADFRLISPGIAVWGLIDPSILFTNFQRRVGAVAQLRGNVTAAGFERDLSDLTESGGYIHPSSQLTVTTVADHLRHNLWNTIWFVLFATACAVFVVVLRRSITGFGQLPDGFVGRTVWLGFLAVKSILLLTITGIGSWCAVHWIASWTVGSSNPTADEYSMWLFLPLAIIALSWSVRDQQSRCRTCLRRLELPVEIGRSGSVLLNWAGTEMVCSEGHGVLYVPESSANSLDQDRWSKLDDSWANLFGDHSR
jgi:hypothetical protein